MKIEARIRRNSKIDAFLHSKSGMTGIAILLFLIAITIYAAVAVPLESFRQWNNPQYWIDYPKSAAPAWTNTGLFGPKVPEHVILSSKDAQISEAASDGIREVTHSYEIDFNFDQQPSDFMIPYSVKYSSTSPLLQIDVLRPDGMEFRAYYSSLPSQQLGGDGEFSSRVFSTDRSISENLRARLGSFEYRQDPTRPNVMIFSDAHENKVLKGTYVISEKFYLFEDSDSVVNSGLILGGKVYGVAGTDELRRDLAIGILWGTPVALFIGVVVSTATIFIGLIYGVVSGYKGRRTDEGMMRVNDIFYSLPVLPFLIILSYTIGRSIFLITGFIVIFSWVGMAKISRSLALQIKNFQYIEAARLMGQSDLKIIFKHIIPQLLPLAFANIAIAVPGAIVAEATLSFLGLGDPNLPTWGQILNEARAASAPARGLWWWIVPPGIMIAITGLAFVLIGTTVESIVNPRSKSAASKK